MLHHFREWCDDMVDIVHTVSSSTPDFLLSVAEKQLNVVIEQRDGRVL